jgi:LCP family protein required for cell wall assembly
MCVGLFVYTLTAKPEADPVKDVVTYLETDAKGETKVVEAVQIEGSYNFLILGYDNSLMSIGQQGNAGLTDVIMLVNLDLNKKTLTITQFPRDTFVSEDVPVHKINATYETYYYQEVNNGMSDEEAKAKATERFADTLENALGINIKYHAIMNLEGFGKIVDMLGGVEVNVPNELVYTDEAQNLYINLKPGLQVLNGDQAIQFVRYRKGYVQADIGRGNAQKIFLASLLKQIKGSDIATLTGLASEILKYTSTNITAEDLIYFAKGLIGEVDLSNMKMYTAPGNAPGLGVSYIVQRDRLMDIIVTNYNTIGVDDETLRENFDKNLYFVNGDPTFQSIYYNTGDPVINYEFDAQDIVDHSIDIPMT